MKKLVYLILFVTFYANSQSYTVIHTIGKIYDTSSDSYLKKGSKISEKSSLKFETEGARAAALSSTRGRFVIQKEAKDASSNDIAYALASVISPVRGKLSTRAGAINNKLDFQKYFQKGSIALLGETYKIDVSQGSYPINDSKFFYAQYMLNGESINKKLGGENGRIVMDISEFFSVDGSTIDSGSVDDIKLFYYDVTEGTSTFISDMSLVKITDQEIEPLLQEFQADDEGLLEILNALYGSVSQDALNEFR